MKLKVNLVRLLTSSFDQRRQSMSVNDTPPAAFLHRDDVDCHRLQRDRISIIVAITSRLFVCISACDRKLSHLMCRLNSITAMIIKLQRACTVVVLNTNTVESHSNDSSKPDILSPVIIAFFTHFYIYTSK